MTTVSPCGTPPPLLNGKVSIQTSLGTEYECLPGFAMEGNKVIACDTEENAWNTDIPYCFIIEQTHNVVVNNYQSWWLYVVAGILGAIFLLAFVWFVWCACCSAEKKKVAIPVSRSNGCSCCGKNGRRNSVQDGYYISSRRAPTQQCYHSPRGLVNVEDDVFFVPVRSVDQNPQVTRHTEPMSATSSMDGDPPQCDGMWQNAVHTVITENRQKKARELKEWKPHKHSVRMINTSTK